MFHALSGCDTVSEKLLGQYNYMEFISRAYCCSGISADKISEQCMHVIERFVILIYDRKSTCVNVNQARKKLFARKNLVFRAAPILPAEFLEKYDDKSKEQNAGKCWKIVVEGLELSVLCMEKIKILALRS